MTIDKEKYIGKALTKLFIKQKLYKNNTRKSDYEVIGYKTCEYSLLYIVAIASNGVQHPIFGKKRLKYLEELLNSKINCSANGCNVHLDEHQVDNLYTLLKLKGIE